MKKTAISLLLVLAMVASFVLVAAPAVNAVEHPNATAANTHTHDNSWTAVSSEAELYNATAEGKYYLSADVDMNGNLDDNSTAAIWKPAAGAEITLCLNGHELKRTSGSSKNVARLIFPQAGTATDPTIVNICDCQSTGTITTTNIAMTGTYASLLHILDYTTVNIYGGNWTTPTDARKTPAIYLGADHSELNIYGGTINGGKYNNQGAALDVNKGVVNMYGGTIQDGETTASSGGNVRVRANGTFNMSGGTIKDGISATHGSNITCVGTLNLTGGSIEGGTCSVGDSVYISNTATVAGGAVTITSDAQINAPIYTELKSNRAGFNVNTDQYLYVDLNGMTLSGTLTTAAGKLVLADSSATFEAAGTGKLDAIFNASHIAQGAYSSAGRYITLADDTSDWGYSVHRIYIGFETIQLSKDGNNIGMNYVTNFKADEEVLELLANGSNGFAVGCRFGVDNLTGARTVGYGEDAFKAKIATEINAILDGEGDAEAYAKKICAQSFITLNIDNTPITIDSNIYQYSLKDVYTAMGKVAAGEVEGSVLEGTALEIYEFIGQQYSAVVNS